MKSEEKNIEKFADKQCKNGKGRICKLQSCKLTSLGMFRDTADVCIIVSNEDTYLDEWIDSHLGILFEHMYIYDNTTDLELGHGWLDYHPCLREELQLYLSQVIQCKFPHSKIA